MSVIEVNGKNLEVLKDKIVDSTIVTHAEPSLLNPETHLNGIRIDAVSYTHLTLPTNREV